MQKALSAKCPPCAGCCHYPQKSSRHMRWEWSSTRTHQNLPEPSRIFCLSDVFFWGCPGWCSVLPGESKHMQVPPGGGADSELGLVKDERADLPKGRHSARRADIRARQLGLKSPRQHLPLSNLEQVTQTLCASVFLSIKCG